MRRPAFLTACWFGFGTLVQAVNPLPIGHWVLAVLGCLMIGATVAFYLKSEGTGTILLCGILVLLGAVRFDLGVQHISSDHYVRLLRDGEARVSGRVVSEPEQRATGWRAEVDVRHIAYGDTTWQTSGVLLVSFGARIPMMTFGDSVAFRAILQIPQPARNPGAFNYQEYLELRGIRALARVTKTEEVLAHTVRRGVWWLELIAPIRRTIQRAVDFNLSGGPAGLLKGILLGDKQAVPADVREWFTRCGVNHVLAVSGLHVGLIASIGFFGLRMCGLGRGLTAILTVSLCWVYALVTGLPPSVIRACVMATVVIVGQWGGWETDGWNALGVACLIGLIYRPADILDVGFQLSFTATAGILLLYRPVLNLLPQWGGRLFQGSIWGPLAVSVAAQLATMPFIVTYFGIVSIVGIVANLIIVPLIGAGAALGLLTVLIFPFVPDVVVLLNGANWVLLKGAILLAEFMAEPEWAALILPRLSGFVWILYGLSVMLVLPLFRQPRYFAYVLGGILVCGNYSIWKPILIPERYLEMFVLDVGQGDGVFIRLPNGKTMLIDAGIRNQHVDMGQRVVMPFLRHRGISRIDVMIGSHAHSDHIGGLISVLRQVEVGHYLDSGQQPNSWTAGEVRRLVTEQGAKYHEVCAGDSLVGLGGVGGVVMHPSPVQDAQSEEGGNLNNGSVVVQLSYLGWRILLTGDIEHETDPELVRWKERLQTDILKVAHHGSRTSSTPEFLRATQPTWATISCGIKNKFRHPSPEVIDRFNRMGIEVLRTDELGAIRFVIDETGVSRLGWVQKKTTQKGRLF